MYWPHTAQCRRSSQSITPAMNSIMPSIRSFAVPHRVQSTLAEHCQKNAGLLKPNDIRFEQSQKEKFFDQSNLWTIGQLIEKPELPNGVPAGNPVIKPSCA
jgi:hypothetical protein